MNLEVDTWDVITSYFKDPAIPNYLVRHHIDSYNDFVHNKIPKIMKNFEKTPSYVLIDKEDRNIIYEIKVYYGGKNHDRYKITRPTVVNYPSGEIRQLYPNEARLKDITYGFDFFYDVDIEYTMRRGDQIILDKVPSPYTEALRNIHLGKIPIMLRSDMCALSAAVHNPELLTQMGEDKYDLGGYFILDGAEKVIVSQERKAENIVFLQTINHSGNEKFTHTAEVKCVSDEAFANARTVKLQLENKGTITVRLGQDKPLLNENDKRDVPLFIMFRALGVESDQEIMKYIIGSLEGELAEKMMDLLRPSILDPFILHEEIYDRERAEEYLMKLTARSQQSDRKDTAPNFSEIIKNKKVKLCYLFDTFRESLFPHISSTTGDIYKAKAFYLGYMTRKLLLLRLGLVSDTDRDNFCNKRIDLSGFLLSTLFRDSFQQVIRNARVETNRKYTFNAKEYSGSEHITSIINDGNIREIFSADVFKKHFNGALKIGTIGQKKGIVQALDRVTRNLTIAHLRRIIDNVAGGRVTIPRRRLHASQYGCVCPVETPEGAKVGLNKGLALISHITFGTPTKYIIQFLIDEGLEVLDDLTPVEAQRICKIFVNGNWVGCHHNPEVLQKIFVLYRRNGLINVFISFSWDRSSNEVQIFTDGGRFVRPLYVIEDNNLLLQPRHIRGIKSNELSFTDLVAGFRKRREEYDYYSQDVKSLSILGLDKSDALYIEKLGETQSVIEYIDCQEFNTCMLPIGFTIDHTSLQRFTHIELHPSMFLSFNAHLLPFGDHNASGRTIFASKHVKQGISTYALNFNSRIDTSSHILNYSQRPLVQSRLQKYITQDIFGQGMNIYVAIASYNYNQEDAIVGNQSAIDMGLFHTTYYKSYKDMEITESKTGEETRFFNPLYTHEIPQYPQLLNEKTRQNYDKLDKWGFPRRGEFLEVDDIVICKYIKTKDQTGADIERELSTTTKTGNEGSFIDRVYTWQTNAVGDRAVKVRTCQNRPPIIGDKFASRCAQKGTFGITLKKEDLPYTEDGIIPDFVLDPGSYPKRMTVSQFIEILFGNLASELGFIGSFNAFETIDVEQINHVMEDMLGFTSYGDRILYNGYTGEQIDVKIFSGCIYYQRLKYMVDDKINTRYSGKRINGIPVPGGLYTVKERQSVAGRANGGGLKFGEMERDALIAHGMWGFIKESYIERCDKFIIQVSVKSGDISIANPEIGLFYDNVADGVVSYHLVEGIGNKGLTPERILGLNLYNQKSLDFITLVVPYTFKLLIQEMEGMMIQVRFDVSRLRRILPDNIAPGEIAELTHEMLDEMMEDDDVDKNIDDDMDIDEYDYNMGEDDISQTGGADTGEQSDEESNSKSEGESELEPESDTEKEVSELESDTNEILPTSSLISPTISDNTMSSPNPNNPINSQLMQPSSQAMISNNSSIPVTNTMQSNTSIISNTSIPPNIEVSPMGRNNDDSQAVDLSQYGGVKPDFDVMEREDDKAIENLNAQLLGIQTGGQNESLERAKQQGIESVINAINPPMQQMPQIQLNGGGIPSSNAEGLNFSFNQQQQPMQQSVPYEQRPQLSMQMPMQNQNQMQQSAGGAPIKQVSFNNDIKVVELDTKISEGFLYSGSKNLDPFGQ